MADSVEGQAGGTNGNAAQAEATSSCRMVSFACQTEVVPVGVLAERLKDYAQGGFGNKVLFLDQACYDKLLPLLKEHGGLKIEARSGGRAKTGETKWADLEKRYTITVEEYDNRMKTEKLGYLSPMPAFGTTVLKSRVFVDDKDGHMYKEKQTSKMHQRVIPLQHIPSYQQEWKKGKQQDQATFDDFVAHCVEYTSLNKAILGFWKKDWDPPKLKARVNSKRPRDEYSSDDEDLEAHPNKKMPPPDPPLAAEDLPLQLGNGEVQLPAREPVSNIRNNSSAYSSSVLNGNHSVQQWTNNVQLNIFVGNGNQGSHNELYLRHQHYLEQLRQHGHPEPSIDQLHAHWFSHYGVPFHLYNP